MMEEPFWLGLLAVLIVLGILGLGYTVKKHLPDKFDRLIAEDGTKTQSAKTSNASNIGGLPGEYKFLFFSLFFWLKIALDE